MKAIDHDMHCIDVAHELESIDLEALPDMLIGQFNTKMVSISDNHTPEKSKSRTVKPRYRWYDNFINDQWRLGRKYERRWRKSGSQEDKKVYVDQKTLVNQLIDKAKIEYYNVKLYACNVKGVFKTVNTLLNNKKKKKKNHSFAHWVLNKNFVW